MPLPAQSPAERISRARPSWWAALTVLLLGVLLTQVPSWLIRGQVGTAIAERQLAAARALCGTPDHPDPAQVPGAAWRIDCAREPEVWFSLRGLLEETQQAELINPRNRLAQSVAQDAFELAAAALPEAPGVFDNGDRVLAFGYGVSGRWTAQVNRFKWLSLWRPLRPGPVWLLVVQTRCAGDCQRARARAADAFSEVQTALAEAARATGPVPASP